MDTALDYLAEGSGREQDAKLTTLFRFAQYFGGEKSFAHRSSFSVENEEDTQLVAGLLDDVTWVLTSGRLDVARAMLWSDERRGSETNDI